MRAELQGRCDEGLQIWGIGRARAEAPFAGRQYRHHRQAQWQYGESRIEGADRGVGAGAGAGTSGGTQTNRSTAQAANADPTGAADGTRRE